MARSGGGDDVAFVRGRFENTRNRGVVALRATAREDDFLRRAGQERRDLTPRAFHGFLGRRPRPVMARRVAVVVGQERPHGFRDLGRDGRACIVVEIDHVDYDSDLVLFNQAQGLEARVVPPPGAQSASGD